MIQWGLFFGAVQGNNVITFSPVFQNQCLHVTVSCVTVTGNVAVVVVPATVSVSGFTANLSPVIPLVPVQISWLAIGY